MAGKQKAYVLLKDIVVPRGTVFYQAPIKTERSEDHYDTVIGLTKNTAGDLTYCIDESFEELNEWFAELKER